MAKHFGCSDYCAIGYHWQVGDSKSIGVWMDHWLRRPSTFRVLTPPTLLPVNTTMDSLMDQESGEWNLNLINQVFFHEDATSILSIPLSRHKPKDCMIWAFTPRGCFTINSAYKVARTITQLPTSAETSQSNEQAWFWCHIWNLHIPNKIKKWDNYR